MAYWTLTKHFKKETLEQLMAGHIPWEITMGQRDGSPRKPDNIEYIHVGDKFLVYFSEGKGVFYGTGILRKIEPKGNNYYLYFHNRKGDKGFDSFARPKEYVSLKDKLDWKPKMGSIRLISPTDFETVVTGRRRLPTQSNEGTKASRASKEVLKRKYGPWGEGQEHRKLKEWIRKNPTSIHIDSDAQGVAEYEFPSRDAVDILFTLSNGNFVVVEVETCNAKPGAYQALKYRTLKCAECGIDLSSPMVQPVLAAYEIPEDVEQLCSRYGVRYVKLEKTPWKK